MYEKMKDNEFKLFTAETSVVVITVVLLCLTDFETFDKVVTIL